MIAQIETLYLNKMRTLPDGDKMKFLAESIKTFLNSEQYELMCRGMDYYKNENDILFRTLKAVTPGGNEVPALFVSNKKLCHPFMRKLTDQKTDYMFTKPFSVSAEDKSYTALLNNYFDKNFLRLLKNVGTDAIVRGLAWLQVYYDEKGKFSFKRIPATEIIPFWNDYEHTDLEAVIRIYTVSVWDGGAFKAVQKVEYYHKKGVEYYVYDGCSLKVDLEAKQKRPKGNMTKNGKHYVWEKLPFICFKYNHNELSLLKFIKTLVDEYDCATSDLGNLLTDVPNAIKIVRGYGGTDPGEFINNLRLYRIAFVDQDGTSDGGVDALNTPIDADAAEKHLTRLRDDIYESGRGVDTQNNEVGNASGVSLKFIYADLDMDCSNLGNEFSASMEQLIWFINQDIANQGHGNYTDRNVDIVWNMDIVINEAETIQNAAASNGLLSEETCIENHPWVEDVDEEIRRKEAEREKAIQDMAKLEFTQQPNAGGGLALGES